MPHKSYSFSENLTSHGNNASTAAPSKHKNVTHAELSSPWFLQGSSSSINSSFNQDFLMDDDFSIIQGSYFENSLPREGHRDKDGDDSVGGYRLEYIAEILDSDGSQNYDGY